MSIINSIPKFKKPIGKGYSRVAYYSRKYDLVVKAERREKTEGGEEENCFFQNRREIRIFESMTEEEKQFTAVKGHIEYKGKTYILAEKVKPIENYYGSDFNHLTKKFDRMTLDPRHPFAKMVKRLSIGDLHRGNMGVTKDGRLVILDMGF